MFSAEVEVFAVPITTDDFSRATTRSGKAQPDRMDPRDDLKTGRL